MLYAIIDKLTDAEQWQNFDASVYCSWQFRVLFNIAHHHSASNNMASWQQPELQVEY